MTFSLKTSFLALVTPMVLLNFFGTSAMANRVGDTITLKSGSNVRRADNCKVITTTTKVTTHTVVGEPTTMACMPDKNQLFTPVVVGGVKAIVATSLTTSTSIPRPGTTFKIGQKVVVNTSVCLRLRASSITGTPIRCLNPGTVLTVMSVGNPVTLGGQSIIPVEVRTANGILGFVSGQWIKVK